MRPVLAGSGSARSSGDAVLGLRAGDAGEVSAVLLRALIVGAVAGLGFVALQSVLFAGAFALAPASTAVEGVAREYLTIRIWGAPATIALYSLTGWLIGLERTRGVLILQLVQNGLNLGLSFWLGFGLGCGVGGVAVAKLIAELAGLALALWLARDAFGPGLRQGLARLGDRLAIRRMFFGQRGIMARAIILQPAFTTFIFLGATMAR